VVPDWLDSRRLHIACVAGLTACSGPPTVIALAPAPPPPLAASTPAGRAALTLAAVTPVPPREIVVKDDTVRYPVRGTTIAAIAHDLGVERSAESDYIGATTTRVQWQFAQQHVDDTCAISDVVVTLEIETRLPAWERLPGVSPTLVRQWATFLDATERHENGHRNIALHTAAAMAQSLVDEHGLPCAELDQLANASAQAQWDLGHQHQLAYDAATRHGETQGSRWPPFLGEP
jgi:predicted secreted Zn-dependent protease